MGGPLLFSGGGRGEVQLQVFTREPRGLQTFMFRGVTNNAPTRGSVSRLVQILGITFTIIRR